MGPAGLIDDAIIGMIALNRVFKAMGQAGDILRQYWDGDDVLKVMQELLDRADRRDRPGVERHQEIYVRRGG